MEAAKNADPLRHRFDNLQREKSRLENKMERLVTAYQEGLLSLEELRQRIPDLRKQQEAHDSEIQSLQAASVDQDRYLSLMESLSEFGERLKSKANTLDVVERQKILRMLVKEVLVNDDSITIRHSIPLPQAKKEGTILPIPEPQFKKTEKSYLLSSGGSFTNSGQHLSSLCAGPLVRKG